MTTEIQPLAAGAGQPPKRPVRTTWPGDDDEERWRSASGTYTTNTGHVTITNIRLNA